MLLQALSLGCEVDVWRPREGVVHGVFEQAVNLLVDEELWTVLGAARADAPFGIRVAAGAGAWAVKPAELVHVRAGFVNVGKLILDCRTAARWVPPRGARPAVGLAIRLPARAREVADKVLAAAEASAKPVVAIFLGADPETITRHGVHGAADLAQAADMGSARNRAAAAAQSLAVSNEAERVIDKLARSMAPSQRYERGIYSGGTFCFEAQLIHAAAGFLAFSNAPTSGNQKLVNVNKSAEYTIIDMGDDNFTQGRPHPMIDPSLRDARIRDEATDPTTAVVLFDVVLGYGASADPTAGLISVIAQAKAKAQAEGRVAFLGCVCGTDQDPQNRAAIVAGLQSAGVLVASSNAEAATWSAALISKRKGATA